MRPWIVHTTVLAPDKDGHLWARCACGAVLPVVRMARPCQPYNWVTAWHSHGHRWRQGRRHDLWRAWYAAGGHPDPYRAPCASGLDLGPGDAVDRCAVCPVAVWVRGRLPDWVRQPADTDPRPAVVLDGVASVPVQLSLFTGVS